MANFQSILQQLWGKPTTIAAQEVANPSLTSKQLQDLRTMGMSISGLQELVNKQVAVSYDRISLYQEVISASQHPIMSGAIYLYGSTATVYNRENNATVWCTSDNEAYTAAIESLFDKINLEERIFDWASAIITYGDLFIDINAQPGAGILSVDDSKAPVEFYRIEKDGALLGFFHQHYSSQSNKDSTVSLLPPWKLVHLMLSNTMKRRPVYGDNYGYRTSIIGVGGNTMQESSMYGSPLIMPALPVLKRLRLAEDSVLMGRATRTPLKYLYKVGIPNDGTNIEAVQEIMKSYANILKRARSLNVTPGNQSYNDRLNNLGMCLAGDTKIPLLSGECPTIKEMSENKDKYVGKGIYTINEKTSCFEPNRILDAKLTRKNAELVRVHLDDGKHVDCTPDHRFMMRDASFKEAKDLKPFDSLMPLYRKFEGKVLGKYEQIYNPGKNVWNFTHREVLKNIINIDKIPRGYTVHHGPDFTPTNNDMDNLSLMGSKEHKEYHRLLRTLPTETRTCQCGNTFEVKPNQKRDSSRQYCSHKCGGESIKKIRTGKSYEELYGSKAEELKKKCSDSHKGIKYGNRKSPIITEEHVESIKKANLVPKERFCKYCEESMTLTGYKFMSHIKKCRNLFLNQKESPILNHKVVKIEFLLERQDTYDLTIENNHNFALDVGIFVHNSEDILAAVWGDVNNLQVEKLGGDVDIKWLCLRGDTKIKLLDGTTPTIKEMADNKSEYVGKYAYACNKEGEVVARPIRNIAMTRPQTEFVRVTLDNGKFVDTTHDHPFMLRNGIFEEAQYLKPGQSLMPLYTKISDKKLMHGYELFYNPKTGKYQPTHQMVAKSVQSLKAEHDLKHDELIKTGKEKFLVVHHKTISKQDNKLNNDPSNLQWMGHIEHQDYHHNLKSWNEEKDFTCKHCGVHLGEMKLSDYMNHIQWDCSETQRPAKRVLSDNRKSGISKISSNSKWVVNPLTKEEKFVLLNQIDSFLALGWITGRNTVKQETRDKVAQRASNSKWVHNSFEERFVSLDKVSSLLGDGWQTGRLPGQKRSKSVYMNHKVVSVESLNVIEDAYDLQIEGNYDKNGGPEHCFAVEAGVFVHNTDVDKLEGQVCTALCIPQPLLGGTAGDAAQGLSPNSSLENMDIRFARGVSRVQRSLLQGLTRLCQIHLGFLNMDPDTKLFELHMHDASDAGENEKCENLKAKIEVTSSLFDALAKVVGEDKLNRKNVFDICNDNYLKLPDLKYEDLLLPEGKTNTPVTPESGVAPTGEEITAAPEQSPAQLNASKVKANRKFLGEKIVSSQANQGDLKAFTSREQKVWESLYGKVTGKIVLEKKGR